MSKKFIDSRAVDLKFLEDLKFGKLKYFLESVKKHPELELCFRGNRGKGKQAVTIYRDNHIVWDIETSDFRNYAVKINFNHARYTEKWDELRSGLQQLGFYIEDIVCKSQGDGKTPAYDIAYPVISLSDYTKEFVEDSYQLLKKAFDDYFNYDGNHSYNYFRKDYNDKNKIDDKFKPYKRPLVEKIYQQKLFSNVLNGLGSNYFAYDLEFEQPYPTQDYKKNKGIRTNKPDMLAIKEENGRYKLVLVEVKSTKSACTDKSGVAKHLKGMLKYIDEKISYEFKGKVVYDEFVMKARRRDAIEIIKAYKFLGLRKIESNNKFWNKFSFDISDVDKTLKDIEIIFIFTDKNIGKGYNYAHNDDDAIKWYKEELKNGNSSIQNVVNVINKKNLVVKFATYTDLNGLT